MDEYKKAKIEIDQDEVKSFQLWCLAKMLSANDRFEYLKHEKIRDGRLIIHVKVIKNLTE